MYSIIVGGGERDDGVEEGECDICCGNGIASWLMEFTGAEKKFVHEK
jgi:hypothetical protein